MSESPHQIPEEAVREELGRVLTSHEFRSSKRSQEFLRFVVDRALTGEADQLKERTIGIEVFGRPTSYDPSEDATVRVKAGEVRKRLGLYYASEGARNRVRIEVPAGTYVPEFHWRNGASAAGEIQPQNPNGSIPADSRGVLSHVRHGKWWIAGAIALLVIAGAVYQWMGSGERSTTVDNFWSPVVQGTSPISVCAAFVPVYALNGAIPQSGPRVEDFVPLNDQFVGGGDLIAVSRISALLTRMQRPYRVKIGDAVSFEDLRTSPAILVGYSYTHWKEISQAMRFFIDTSRTPPGITDGGAPTKWVLSTLPANRRTAEDYALVTRVFHPDTHAMLVELAGITQYGTDAAADFVTNNDLLKDALREAPSGWQRKNLQFVLHVKVISGTPSAPKVVASYIW